MATWAKHREVRNFFLPAATVQVWAGLVAYRRNKEPVNGTGQQPGRYICTLPELAGQILPFNLLGLPHI
jgi:hypothetical protein